MATAGRGPDPADPRRSPSATPPSEASRSRARRRLWASGTAVAVLVAIVVALLQVTGDEPQPSGPAVSSDDVPRLTRADWNGTAAGVFRGTDADEVRGFEEWLGAPMDVVLDFPARATWYDISSPDYLLEEWQDSELRLVLSVAMLPTDVAGVSIQAGAEGEYDEYFRTLGEKLVSYGFEDAILRIGWEFNLDSWPWYTDDAEAWTTYFRRIVAQLREVEGQQFRIDWNVNNGPGGPDPVDYWPGDDAVDYVGVDAYDVAGREGVYPIPADCTGSCAAERRERAWDDVVYGGERGLRFWSEFAEQHDKQLSLPEWGVWERSDGIGGGDNPRYIEQMADFIADPENHVGYQAYFESEGVVGTHRLMTALPDSGNRFRQLFSGA